MPPVRKAMSADGFRLSFVLVRAFSPLYKFVAIEVYKRIALLARKCAKNTLTHLGLANAVSHLGGGLADTQTAHRRNGLLTHKLSKTHQLPSTSTRKRISSKS